MIRLSFDASEMEALGASLEARGAQAGAAIGAAIAAMIAPIEEAAVEEVRAVTPIGKPNPFDTEYKPGALQEETHPATVRDALGFTTDVIQDAEHDGFFYGAAVREGRGAIEAPSSGPWNRGKEALTTPWGPRKSVKASEPQPYQIAAEAGIQTATDAITARYGDEIARELMSF